MNVIELIGFLITVAALIFLTYRRAKEERQRQDDPERYAEQEQQQQEQMKEFLKALNIEVEEVERPPLPPAEPPPPPSSKPKSLQGRPRTPLFEPQAAEYLLETEVEEHDYIARTGRGYTPSFGKVEADLQMKYAYQDPLYAIHEEEEVSAAANILSSLRSPQEMVILSEILHRPKGL